MEKDGDTGVSIPFIFSIGRIVFYSQKIEQKLKQIITMRHKMGKARNFKIGEIKNLKLNRLIEEVLTYDILKPEGKKSLRSFQNNRNTVVHKLFEKFGVDKETSTEQEEAVLRKLQKIEQELFDLEVKFWHIWKHHDIEHQVFKFSRVLE